MKEGIGTIWITGLVVTFMLIFSGYLAVTISYSSTLKMKNTILTIIEKRNGVTNNPGKQVSGYKFLDDDKTTTVIRKSFGTLQSLNLYLLGNGYNTTGNCPNNENVNGENIVWYGVKDIKKTVNSNKYPVSYEQAKSEKKYYYCFAKLSAATKSNGKKVGSFGNAAYYRIRLFYQLNVPIADSIIFTVDGKTGFIKSPTCNEIKQFKKCKE